MGALKVVAFDLDGTVTRRPTVCEAIAARLGRAADMAAFEQARDRAGIAAAREVMAGWYAGVPVEELLAPVREIPLRPGAREALALCHEAGARAVLVSITWTFAVDWFAREQGFDAAVGTALGQGEIAHFWPEDKPAWLAAYCARHGVEQPATAAVGDSWGDGPLLAWAGRGAYVGAGSPPVEGLMHLPDAPLDAAVAALLGP